jgi:hypothetical protein
VIPHGLGSFPDRCRAVHEDIDPAECGKHILNQLTDRRTIRDIALERPGGVATLLQIRGHSTTGLGGDLGNCHTGASLSQRPAELRPQQPPSAGHEGGASAEVELVLDRHSASHGLAV